MEKQDKIEIPSSGTMEGYVWWSDQTSPQVYEQGTFGGLESRASDNPFVIEAQLYDDKERVSYGIKHVDGHYIVCKHEGVERNASEEQSYVAHRMPNVGGLVFRQEWVAEKDELCEGMEVLRPSAVVFVGFKK